MISLGSSLLFPCITHSAIPHEMRDNIMVCCMTRPDGLAEWRYGMHHFPPPSEEALISVRRGHAAHTHLFSSFPSFLRSTSCSCFFLRSLFCFSFFSLRFNIATISASVFWTKMGKKEIIVTYSADDETSDIVHIQGGCRTHNGRCWHPSTRIPQSVCPYTTQQL